jgi:hypothetical protein
MAPTIFATRAARISDYAWRKNEANSPKSPKVKSCFIYERTHQMTENKAS